MPTITIGTNIGGVSRSKQITRTGSTFTHPETLVAGKTGTLSTRTDDDTGVLTLGSSHGITDANVVDVYWTGGMRKRMSVTAYDATTITVNAGTGDNFPTESTAIVAGKRATIAFAAVGANVEMLVASCDYRACIDFVTSVPASIKAVELTADEPWIWIADWGTDNPVTGSTIAGIEYSAGTASGGTLNVEAVYDATP